MVARRGIEPRTHGFSDRNHKGVINVYQNRIKIQNVRLLFEQSGTFKTVFKDMGYKAFSYDIENSFNETDYKLDLFQEIINESQGKKSIFNDFDDNDLILAFFPCTYFSIQNKLIFSKQVPNFKNWEPGKVTNYINARIKKRDEYYDLFKKFVNIVKKYKLKTIIENPYSGNYLLQQKEIKKPDVIIKNRRLYGDYYRKPTMFYFYNFDPSYWSSYLLLTNTISKKINEENGITRSLIHKDFAYNFINKYVLGLIK
ncbi:MAG: hypothetical protein ACOCRK_11275 [bacterium]